MRDTCHFVCVTLAFFQLFFFCYPLTVIIELQRKDRLMRCDVCFFVKLRLALKKNTLQGPTQISAHGKCPSRLTYIYYHEICVLRYYAASSGKSVPKFREVVPKRRCGITARRCITSQKSADLIYIAAEA